MKRITALLLALSLAFSGCTSSTANSPNTSASAGTTPQVETAVTDSKKTSEAESTLFAQDNDFETQTVITAPEESNNAGNGTAAEKELEFTGLNDPVLLQYIEDSVYSDLVNEFSSEDYIIENVKATYISKEYLEEVTYNSQATLFFGYTLAELDVQFQGTKYVFTLGDNGETTVVPLVDYDDTYEKVLKNVAVGTGVILVCVTVSMVTGGAGLAPVSIVFAASAKRATKFAISGALIGGVSAGVVEGIKTGDFDSALKAAALGGSEGFKWGAILGALDGGASKLSAIHRTSKAVEGATEFAKGTVEIADDLPQWRQAELRELNKIGGFEQLSYLNRKQVPFGTEGATRPDVVHVLGDHIEAVEVKYYDLENPTSLNTLYRTLVREVTARVKNLPKGATQKIILDVTGRRFSEDTCETVKKTIWSILDDVYPNIPIEIVGTR